MGTGTRPSRIIQAWEDLADFERHVKKNTSLLPGDRYNYLVPISDFPEHSRV